MRSVPFLALILELSWRCFGAEPIIVPDDIFTQAGCNVTTKCSAENPRRIEWSTRRTSFTFENTTTRSAWVTTDGDTAILSFTNITRDDGSEYSCITIFQDLSSIVNTIRVIVDPGEPIKMEPIGNYTVDNVVIGETITVGCVIQSDCGTSNVVNFTNEQGDVLESIMRDTDGAFNWNPTVDNDLNGTYRCVVENSLGMVYQEFMIIGTPQKPAPSGGGNGSEHTTSLLLVTMLLPLLAAIIYN